MDYCRLDRDVRIRRDVQASCVRQPRYHRKSFVQSDTALQQRPQKPLLSVVSGMFKSFASPYYLMFTCRHIKSKLCVYLNFTSES